MAKRVQLRRGSTVDHTTSFGGFTGGDGEVTVDSTKDILVVHDNSTVGGHPLAKEDLSNVTNSVGTQQLNISNSPGQAGQVIQTDGSNILSFCSADQVILYSKTEFLSLETVAIGKKIFLNSP